MNQALTTTPTSLPTMSPGGLTHELRAVVAVWRREVAWLAHDKRRAVMTLLQPLMYLFVMGTGLAGIVEPGGPLDFKTFLFPGVLAMGVVFTAAFGGVSVVWDRETGFLREMLVAPISKSAIILGKALGAATTAMAQSAVLLLLAGLAGVPYDPLLFVALLALLFVGALLVTALIMLLTVRIKRAQSAMPTSSMVITPMMFLSGALFPVGDLPGWLHVATVLNPFTYVVGPMRAAVFASLDPAVSENVHAGLTWAGWAVPVPVQVLVAVASTVVLLGSAVARFNRTE
ncbi:ABC transporter permease [Saccharomonospora glauca]|uniref:Transport permease protein n=1 Tax=Saccharomonospora glauca K62 TaxID=928724 RepID=I1D7P8_9PSEU|nr:ABC transporter permease [Saccharomonospora glauca]EIF00973.1 ABC-type multidrug transport system, permease component [Saccharomonospora glauca K62]